MAALRACMQSHMQVQPTKATLMFRQHLHPVLRVQEYKQHCAREHAGDMSRAEKRQALTIPVNFQVGVEII